MLARAHQSLIWARQRQINALRSALRDYFPAALAAFGTDLGSADARAVLEIAPTPAQGRALSQAAIARALSRGGRRRNLERRAAEIRTVLRSDHPEARPPVADAFGATTRAQVAVIDSLQAQIAPLEAQLAEHFE